MMSLLMLSPKALLPLCSITSKAADKIFYKIDGNMFFSSALQLALKAIQLAFISPINEVASDAQQPL